MTSLTVGHDLGQSLISTSFDDNDCNQTTHEHFIIDSRFRNPEQWPNSTEFCLQLKEQANNRGGIPGANDVQFIMSMQLVDVKIPSPFFTLDDTTGTVTDGFSDPSLYLYIKEPRDMLRKRPNRPFAILKTSASLEKDIPYPNVTIIGGYWHWPMRRHQRYDQLTFELRDYNGRLITLGDSRTDPSYDGLFITALTPGTTTTIETDAEHNLVIGDTIQVVTEVSSKLLKETNHYTYTVIAITDANTFSIDLNSTDTNSYTYPAIDLIGHILVSKFQVSYILSIIDILNIKE